MNRSDALGDILWGSLDSWWSLYDSGGFECFRAWRHVLVLFHGCTEAKTQEIDFVEALHHTNPAGKAQQ